MQNRHPSLESAWRAIVNLIHVHISNAPRLAGREVLAFKFAHLMHELPFRPRIYMRPLPDIHLNLQLHFISS
jgi:hypothetical protein